jgi:hypothetical protein
MICRYPFLGTLEKNFDNLSTGDNSLLSVNLALLTFSSRTSSKRMETFQRGFGVKMLEGMHVLVPDDFLERTNSLRVCYFDQKDTTMIISEHQTIKSERFRVKDWVAN